jgi:predicted nucleotidyltransferase
MAETLAAAGWEARLRADAARAWRFQSPDERATTAEVCRRAVGAGAIAVALTGSTARGRRTPISDLDYHVVGPAFDPAGLPGEVDVVLDAAERFERRIAEGDFVHWTLREGCVLHDPEGVLGEAWERVEREGLWPQYGRKLAHAAQLARLAERVLGIGDRAAAQEHLRAAASAFARGLLLAEGVFPLSRAELPEQLRAAGLADLGRVLAQSIHAELSPWDLAEGLAMLPR